MHPDAEDIISLYAGPVDPIDPKEAMPEESLSASASVQATLHQIRETAASIQDLTGRNIQHVFGQNAPLPDALTLSIAHRTPRRGDQLRHVDEPALIYDVADRQPGGTLHLEPWDSEIGVNCGDLVIKPGFPADWFYVSREDQGPIHIPGGACDRCGTIPDESVPETALARVRHLSSRADKSIVHREYLCGYCWDAYCEAAESEAEDERTFAALLESTGKGGTGNG